MAILTDLRDPRISNVTVTFVEVSGDLRQATVHVSVMGDEKKQQLCLHGLQSSAGYLQQKIGNRIDTRYTPRIKFVLDQGVKKSAEVSRILGELLPDKSETDDDSLVEAPGDEVPNASPTDASATDSTTTGPDAS